VERPTFRMMKPGAGETDPLGSSASWVRAVTLAASTPEVGEALAGILDEGGGPAGAVAGAVLEMGSGSVRAAWRCAGHPVQALVRRSAELRAAVEEAEEWPESTRVLEVAGDCGGTGFTHLLLAPLRRRGTALGVLLLLHQGAAPPRPRQRAAAGAIAALAALVVENDRLYEEAREALQARDHFLTALNHELRTPATSLMLASDVLRSGFTGDLPPRLERVLQEAEEHVRQMALVLQRVLDLGRASSEAAPAPEAVEVLQPRQAVLKLMQRVEPAAKRKNLTLALHVPRNLPAVQTDVPRFSQILLHLLSNAIKYTSHGGVEVRLERAMRRLTRERQEPVLLIHVRDTGRGIPQPELDRIFEPFAQVEEGARTNSRTRGVGLGLPLAQQLARSLGGDITIESEIGKGTLASFLLPYRSHFG
jgi:signal transduction histidine kinase